MGVRSATRLVGGLSGGELGIFDANDEGVSASAANDLVHTRRVATVEFADDVYRNTLNNLPYLSNGVVIAKAWRSRQCPPLGANPSH